VLDAGYGFAAGGPVAVGRGEGEIAKPPMPNGPAAPGPAAPNAAAPNAAASDATPPDAAPPDAPKPTSPPSEPPIAGPRLTLVDISGSPRVISTYQIDGWVVDARQVGAVARVVIQSSPRIIFPDLPKATDAQRAEANRHIIDQVGLDTWLPRIEVTTGGRTEHPQIGCDAVSRPDVYSGANLLSVLTFDLAAPSLGDGQPTTILADGQTVYSNGPSLYVATDRRWQAVPLAGSDAPTKVEASTTIYKFDTSTPGRPRFAAGGKVPGYLLNQYSMSEWNGYLRVATTTGEPWAEPGKTATSESGIYVLTANGRKLTEVGHVGGLGKGEQIHAVRFTGPVGYVVTFRQTDPLYTVDLSDPEKPAVRGELKIPGYSAYLHPVPTDPQSPNARQNQLIGIGQDADERGQTTGTQVSLFNVTDLGHPTRLATYHLPSSYSQAEFDPHAFLYWPASGLLVVPLQRFEAVGGTVPPTKSDASTSAGGSSTVTATPGAAPAVGALVLHLGNGNITYVGFLHHPAMPESGYSYEIQRSLVIGQTLWTLSDGGLMATDTHSLKRVAWISLR
jgi:hypothetical protein